MEDAHEKDVQPTRLSFLDGKKMKAEFDAKGNVVKEGEDINLPHE